MDESSYLPVYCRRSGARQPRRESPVSRPRTSSPSPHKFVHAIPVIVFLCFFILWRFSHRVNVVFKDGRIEEIHQTEALPFNESHVELAILASATSPISSSTPQNLTISINETLAHPVNKTD